MTQMSLSELISETKIKKRVQEMGKALTQHFAGSNPIAVCVLKGSFVFYADLIREIDMDLRCEFIGCSSYANSTVTSGEVKITMDLSCPIVGRDLLLIEDIVDTGLTMNFLKSHLSVRKPKSITTASLLLKPQALRVECAIDHVGFEIANDFVVGYGLDYQGLYRNLPYIAQVQNMN
jgi:hypoxanthine phosphoribosyltransferase